MKKIATTIFGLLLICGSLFAQRGENGSPVSEKFDKENLQVPFITMPGFNLDSVQRAAAYQDSVKGPYMFGFNHYGNYNPGNSGAWMEFSNGDRIWRLGINSPGAVSLNLAFTGMRLPEGAHVFVYSSDRSTVLGAFTSAQMNPDAMFGTELIESESVIIEYFEPAAVRGQGWMNLFRITHGFRGVAEYVYNMTRGFGDSGNCHNNVVCPGGNAWADQTRSVVCLVSGGSEFCTGALINNTCNDGTPYVLTANHCGTADGTWVFRFNWQSATCNNPGSNPSSVSLSGGTPRAQWAGSDFNLVQINSAIPSNYNVYFSGWNRNNAVVDSSTCIHHPAGDIKKISWARNPTISSTYGGADCWRTTQWTSGVTEPGSSGSPLFDPNHRIIGQLYGGPSYCGAPTGSLNDYYGKVSTSWTGNNTNSTRLSNWLDACNTGVTVLDGYDPNAPTVALDAQMSSVNSPSGIYNVCSGSVTENVVVTLRNAGTSTLTSCDISWQLDANTPTVYNWTGSLNSNSTVQVTLGSLTLPTGSHTITVVVSNPNNGTDGNAGNNTSTSTFTLNVLASAMPPVAEGFQSTPFPAANWTLVNPAGVTWTRSTTTGFNSSASMNIDNFNNDTRGQSDDLRTPPLDFTNSIGPATLTFDVAYARYSATYSDTLGVYVSTDCGVTWTQIFLKGGTTLATVADNTNAFTPTANQWRAESINISSYMGQSGVIFAVRAIGGYGNFVWVDNINITTGTSSVMENPAGAVNVYPNPSNDGLVNIDFGGAVESEASVRVLNTLGQEVQNNTYNNVSKVQLNLPAASEGFYLIEVTTPTGTTVRRVAVGRE